MFTSVVSLLVCADIYAQGMQKIGAVDYLLEMVQNAGFGFASMTVVMTLLVGITAVLTGSGVAAFSLSPAWRLLSPLNLAKALYI